MVVLDSDPLSYGSRLMSGLSIEIVLVNWKSESALLDGHTLHPVEVPVYNNHITSFLVEHRSYT